MYLKTKHSQQSLTRKYTMMAKPTKSLELHYPMIQFLIITGIPREDQGKRVNPSRRPYTQGTQFFSGWYPRDAWTTQATFSKLVGNMVKSPFIGPFTAHRLSALSAVFCSPGLSFVLYSFACSFLSRSVSFHCLGRVHLSLI